MRKRCNLHGSFEDVYWSDVEMYLRAEEFWHDGVGVENPNIDDARNCPEDCGLCNLHLSHTALANVDLTNRCNLNCPICFANANSAGYIYEPSYEEVVEMLKTLRNNRPVPTPAVQFSGGEPTLYPRFLDIVRKARELEFAQIQVATNGLKLAKDGYAQQLVDAGMHVVYLQFDGLRDEDYVKTRGRPLLDIKMKAIENCRKTKPKPLATVLVPTIVNTLNDDQVGEILKFAIENMDVIRGVTYQPVSFAGRISKEERVNQRFTLPDLVDRLERQCDFIEKSDFYPVPCTMPISELASVVDGGKPKVSFSCHPHCGIATYLFVEDGDVIPITRFIDVDSFLNDISSIANDVKGSRIPRLRVAMRSFKLLRRIDRKKAPKVMRPRKLIRSLFFSIGKSGLSDLHWNMLFVGGMHFQDLYNYDIERVKRCVIHYATPDEKRKIVPFCAYNSGPTFRDEIERKYGIPLDEWRSEHQSLS